jgi:sigma-E factor negative regulatory protein RseC
MSKEISHTGKVISVGPQVTTVEIVSKSACASCHAASLCTAFESVRKEVEVPTDPSAGFAVGDEVEVQLRGSLGPKAAVLAYVIPLFILLILVVSLSFTGMHELAVAAVGLGGMALWYGILWLCRGSLEREYRFYARRLQ